jgi:hypothetical protein
MNSWKNGASGCRRDVLERHRAVFKQEKDRSMGKGILGLLFLPLQHRPMISGGNKKLFVGSVDQKAPVFLRSVKGLVTLALSWKIPVSIPISGSRKLDF